MCFQSTSHWRPVIAMIYLLLLCPITAVFGQQAENGDYDPVENYEIPAFFGTGENLKIDEEMVKAYAATFMENCDTGCQLIACGDFEAFANTAELRLATTFEVPGQSGPFLFNAAVLNNSPDLNALLSTLRDCDDRVHPEYLESNSGGNFAHFWEKIDPDDRRTEGMAFALCRPLQPGETGVVTFEAVTTNGCQAFQPRVRISFTSSSPVSGQVISVNPGLQPVSYLVPVENGDSPLAQFTYVEPVMIENTTDEVWTHLIVSADALNSQGEDESISYYIDDLQLNVDPVPPPELSFSGFVLNDCLEEDHNMVTASFEVCTDVAANLSVDGTFDFPDGVTLAAGQSLPSEIVLEAISCFSFELSFAVTGGQAHGAEIGVTLSVKQESPCSDDTIQVISTAVTLPEICGSCNPCLVGQTYVVNAGSGLNLSSTGLPAGTLRDACLNLNGRLLVDADYHFSNVTFNMGPGAEIVVLESNFLKIHKSRMSACERMWRSVTVNPGAGLEVLSSEIADGEHAIQLLNDSRAVIQFNKFHRNHISIFVPEASSGINKVDLLQPIRGNEFAFPAGSVMAPTYPGQATVPGALPLAGIWVNDVDAFEVGSVGTTLAVPNKFSNLYNGIVAYNTNMVVFDTRMNGIVAQGPNFVAGRPNGSGIFARGKSLTAELNVIDNAFTGIQGFAVGFMVRTNVLSDVRVGIHVEKAAHTASISENEIGFHVTGIANLNAIGVPVHYIIGNVLKDTDPERGTAIRLTEKPAADTRSEIRDNDIVIYPNAFGISLWKYHGATLRGNKVKYVTPPVVDNRRAFGIWLLNCVDTRLYSNQVSSSADISYKLHGVVVGVSPQTSICCSSVSGTRFGFTFIGDSYPTNISGCSMAGNYQMLLFEDKISGPDAGPARIGEQELNYNSWIGQPVAAGPFPAHAFYEGTGNVANTSQFIVPPDCPSALSPATVIVNNSTQACPGTANNWFWPDPVRRDLTVYCEIDPACPKFDEDDQFYADYERDSRNAARIVEEVLTVYPNPTSGRLNIRTGSATDQLTSLNLRDLNGKTVMQPILDSNTSSVSLVIDHLPHGVYVLEARTANGIVYYRKVVLQR